MNISLSPKAKTAVIIQPCFFPWRGQFDLISRGDICVFLDTVQYSHHNWYNRNRIMTVQGVKWITVPVLRKNHLKIPIREIRIKNQEKWRKKILGTVYHAYLKRAGFTPLYAELEDMLNQDWELLSDLSQASVLWAFDKLGVGVDFVKASDLDLEPADPIENLINICQAVCAKRYISGPAAKNYIGDGKHFEEAGITLDWMVYPQYPSYRDDCDENLSILDLLFVTGQAAREYIWSRDSAGELITAVGRRQ